MMTQVANSHVASASPNGFGELGTNTNSRIADCQLLKEIFQLEVEPLLQDPEIGPEQTISHYQIDLLSQGILVDSLELASKFRDPTRRFLYYITTTGFRSSPEASPSFHVCGSIRIQLEACSDQEYVNLLRAGLFSDGINLLLNTPRNTDLIRASLMFRDSLKHGVYDIAELEKVILSIKSS